MLQTEESWRHLAVSPRFWFPSMLLFIEIIARAVRPFGARCLELLRLLVSRFFLVDRTASPGIAAWNIFGNITILRRTVTTPSSAADTMGCTTVRVSRRAPTRPERLLRFVRTIRTIWLVRLVVRVVLPVVLGTKCAKPERNIFNCK